MDAGFFRKAVRIMGSNSHVAKDLVKKAGALCTVSRFEHIMGVERLAVELSRLHGEDEEKASLAALGHDIFRDLPGGELLRLANVYGLEPCILEIKQPVLLHGKVAASHIRNEYGIDGDIFESIYWHVSGYHSLPRLAKILMIADMGEETRQFTQAARVREQAKSDLEKSFLNVIRLKIQWSLNSEKYLLPETVLAWNYCIGGADYVSD
ncbi:MAG TPA: bis(5'-nucleosyl)-tetraphosphatase (symmetrical) YqeK [Mesotoga sp.]|jgi:predicted HD superfamily hydrolase involved in NAD metabolism|nr:bis(5'-nucleosyl)-tetraphosphatase (symmetrical) YqeK [Mesotoga sp.]HQC55789.1 bis(5'-nucleosyl)-tetraphosphatase (symmetrical) YqeK [Mesotoga sp.]